MSELILKLLIWPLMAKRDLGSLLILSHLVGVLRSFDVSEGAIVRLNIVTRNFTVQCFLVVF